jgi:type II secretory pathway pseudopilin PulG
LTRFANPQELLHVYFTKRQNDKTTKRQNVRSVKSKNKSFTLLEIVFTIVIIGILLAIFLPVMSSIKLTAQKIKDQSNLRTIAAAWKEAVINRGWRVCGNPERVTSLLEELAGVNYQDGRESSSISDMILNDPHTYISPGDKYAIKVNKEMICHFDGTRVGQFGAFDLWPDVNNFMIVSDTIISYCLVQFLPANAPLDTTPLGFTRGLNKNGLWDEKAGLYGSKGGYVVYADGHVVWFDGSKPARFLKWDRSGYTSDIRQTIPTGSAITCCNRGSICLRPDYRGEDALAILNDIGTGGD